jgi:tetratricopeptide (TPR) repeat protein
MPESSKAMRLALAFAFVWFAAALAAEEAPKLPALAASADIAESDEADAAAPQIEPVVTTPDPTFMIEATNAMDAGEFPKAIETLTAGIATLERESTRYDPALIAPLVQLGDAYVGAREFDKARETYSSALHVERVTAGLHSPEQAAIVYKEAAVLVAQGDLEGANARHEYAFDVLQRAYGPTSVELVPGLYRLAEWYVETRNVFGARALYQRAWANLERVHGERSPELVPALRGLAETYRYERFPPYPVSTKRQPTVQVSTGPGVPTLSSAPELQVNRFSEGERALQAVIAILDSDPETEAVDYALAVLDLADWNLLFDKWDRARTLYQYVDAVLRERAQLSDADVARYVGTPTPLYLPLPMNPSAPPADLRAAPTQGWVELRYALTERGEVKNLVTVDSQPPGLMDIGVRKAFRAARFRPAIERGTPVAVTEQIYRHTFTYFPRRQAPPTPTTDDQDA